MKLNLNIPTTTAPSPADAAMDAMRQPSRFVRRYGYEVCQRGSLTRDYRACVPVRADACADGGDGNAARRGGGERGGR